MKMRMALIKTPLLIPLLVLALTGIVYGDNQFIVITKEVEWTDGMVCQVGEVEFVIDLTESGYVVWVPNTKERYQVPKTHANKITSGDAALRLLVHRQKLYEQNNALVARLEEGQQQQTQLDQAQQQLQLLQQAQQIKQAGDQDLFNQLKMIEQMKRLRKQR